MMTKVSDFARSALLIFGVLAFQTAAGDVEEGIDTCAVTDQGVFLDVVASQQLAQYGATNFIQRHFPLNFIPFGAASGDTGAFWLDNVFPSEYDETAIVPPFLPTDPSADVSPKWGYRKFPALSYYQLMFINRAPSKFESNSNKNTLFLRDIEDRGVKNNLKKKYMSALTCDKMRYFEPLIEEAVDELKRRVTTGGENVISSWKDIVVNLYVDLHLGKVEGGHPSYVLKHASEVIDMHSRLFEGTVGILEQRLRWTACATPAVEAYYEQRRKALVEAGERSAIVYWWSEAGLPKDSIGIEGAHNMLAFGQWVNTLFLAIRAKLEGYISFERIDEAFKVFPPIDFFKKMKKVRSSKHKRRYVVQEAYRMLMPNQFTVSSFEGTPNQNKGKNFIDLDFNHTKSFHWHLPIQAVNDNFDPLTKKTDVGKYDTSRFRDFKIKGCPMLGGRTTSLVESSIDMETIVPKSHEEYIPIFGKGNLSAIQNGQVNNGPKYACFGLGYRRCPAEILNYVFLEKLLEGLSDLEFEVIDESVDNFEIFLRPIDRFQNAVPCGLGRCVDNYRVKGGN